MFEDSVKIRGKYAGYLKALSKAPSNAENTYNNFKVFEKYIDVYMVAPIVGIINGKKAYYDSKDDYTDTAGIMAEQMNKYSARLKYIYRLIVLSDDTLNLTEEEKIDMAFREENNEEAIKIGMELYNAYLLGGLEVLYEKFVGECVDDNDFLAQIYNFVHEFKTEQNIDAVSDDIEILLSN